MALNDHIEVRPLAAAHLRDALTAAQRGDAAAAAGALMSIDAESWTGIQNRLAHLGSSFPELLATVTERNSS